MAVMRIAVVALLLLMPVSALAFDDLRDIARAQERQARSQERQESLLREQALREDRDRRNAARDARSSRRFDRQ